MVVCEVCKSENADGNNFCHDCGSSLRATLLGDWGVLKLWRGTLVAGHYKIDRLLGKGGMGVVYVALDQENGQWVALKLLRPDLLANLEAIKRFVEREIEITRKVNHLNVVQLLAGGQWQIAEQTIAYYTMELLVGQDLEITLTQRSQLALGEALNILKQVCHALKAVHEVGAFHRDLKSSNVFIQEDGTVKLLDFGLAAAQGLSRVTSPRAIIGTPEYMAPEQFRGQYSRDPRRDLYALGVLAYELFTGGLPFKAVDVKDDTERFQKLMELHRDAPVESLRRLRPEIPEWLDKMVHWLLEKDPVYRPRSVKEVLDEIERQTTTDTWPRLPLLGTLFNQRYDIRRQIGRGGMGVVYEAVDRRWGNRFVALKVLQPQHCGNQQFEQLFINEVRLARRIKHENVVCIYDLFETARPPCYAMELVEGQNLAQRLKKDEPLPLAEARALGIQLFSGLGAAHRAGVIHRDIKPENILLNRAGQVKLIDFGIGRAREVLMPLTATGGMGTAHYMAPERADPRRDKKTVDHRVDIYAGGVVLYRMFTGRLPFNDDSEPMVILLQHLNNPPPSPRQFNPDLPKELEQIILRCLEKKPENRYSTAEEVAQALKAVVRTVTAVKRRVPLSKRLVGACEAAHAKVAAAKRRVPLSKLLILLGALRRSYNETSI